MAILKLTKKYKRYPKYKDSGVEWVGEIPEGWEVRRFKQVLAKQYPGIWGDEALGDSNDIKCLRVADFDFDHMSFRNVETVRNISPHERDRKMLINPSLLIEKSGGGEKQPVGRAVLYDTNEEMVCANFIDVLNLKTEYNSKFVTYLLYAAYKGGLNKKAIKQNTGIQNLDTKQYFSEFFAFPDFKQQQNIATHLDEKTVLIDTIIEKKKKQIELLREKRSAIINRAVTKGLDPNVKLVDSGESLIGKIPEGWNIEKLKYIASRPLKYGLNTAEEPRFNKGDPRYIRITDFTHDGVLVRDKFKSLPMSVASGYLLQDGDMLFARTGATVGKTMLYNKEMGLACFAGYLIQMRVNTKKMLPQYLHLLTKSCFYEIWKKSIFIQATIQNISADKYANLVVPIPSLKEQQQIIIRLDQSMSNYEKVIVLIEKSIKLLQEFKSALISNVVTGKVKI